MRRLEDSGAPVEDYDEDTSKKFIHFAVVQVWASCSSGWVEEVVWAGGIQYPKITILPGCQSG